MNNSLKKCAQCGNEYPATTEYFYKRTMLASGIRGECKACTKKYGNENKESILEYKKRRWIKEKEKLTLCNKHHYQKNRPERIKKQKEYYKNNKEKVLKQDKIYRTNNADKINATKAIYKKKNKNRIAARMAEYQKNRIKNDNAFMLSHRLRARISTAIKNQYSKKAFLSMDLIGCTIDECIKHIEKQFKPGMSWSNYGLKGWHIDHIIPCSLFDLTIPDQQKKCFNYTNLQPLWAKENIKKGNKLI